MYIYIYQYYDLDILTTYSNIGVGFNFWITSLDEYIYYNEHFDINGQLMYGNQMENGAHFHFGHLLTIQMIFISILNLFSFFSYNFKLYIKFDELSNFSASCSNSP